MKKTLVLLILISLPCVIFAEFQIGPAALYNWVLAADPAEVAETVSEGVSIDDFTFGADARLKLGIFQVSGLALYSPGFEDPDDPAIIWPAEVELYTDAGIALDFVILRLGLGVGPNLSFILDEGVEDMTRLGGNVKLNADLMLGKFAVSLSYLMFLEDLSIASAQNLADNIEGNLGISVLYKLF